MLALAFTVNCVTCIYDSDIQEVAATATYPADDLLLVSNNCNRCRSIPASFMRLALSMAGALTPDRYRVEELEVQSPVCQRDFDSRDHMARV